MTLDYWRDLMIVFGVAITGLVLGSSILIPFAVALLLFILLTATIDWIARFGVPRWLAHLAAFGLVLFGLAIIMTILGSQAAAVAEAIPRYEDRFAALVSRIVSAVGEENAAIVKETIEGIDLSDVAVETLGGASTFLSAFLLVLLYIPFMMIERTPMANKLPRAAGGAAAGAEVMDVVMEISHGMQRYVGVKTFVSVLTGLLSYVVMKFIGLDFAETWAVLAFALNFIPSIGSLLGVVFPSIVALVQFDTIGPFLVIAVGCGVVQLMIGNVLEPALTGRSLNLSPLMVILALIFWTALWGVSGAFLSVPITVCVLIIFSHVPATRPIAVLMSRDGRLRGDPDDTSCLEDANCNAQSQNPPKEEQ
jgi:predicted PurR-regulated permease PerM